MAVRVRPKSRNVAAGKAGPANAGRWPKWLPGLVLVLVTVAVFWPVCGHDFVTWDDFPNVAANPRLNPPTLDAVGRFWTEVRHPYLFMYIPLTYTEWAVLAGMAWVRTADPFGVHLNPVLFHIANLVVHLAAAYFAYRLLLVLVRKPWAACAGALLFAIHPVQVEPVAWVTGMKDVLSGALSLGAMWLYVAGAAEFAPGREGEMPARRRGATYGAATVLFVLAMLAKPSAVTVPLMALVLDRWVLRRSWKQVGMWVAPWVLLAIPIALEAKFAQPPVVMTEGGPAWARPLLATDALAFYVYKIVFPAWLAVQYYHSPTVAISHRWVFFTWMVPAAIAVVVLLYRRRAPWLLAAAGLIVVGTLPVLGLVPFYFQTWSLVADRYLYVAMVGPALVVAAMLAAARPRRRVIVACVVVGCVLGARSWAQTWVWHDTPTLFAHNLKVNPRSDAAFENLGAWNVMNNRPQQAIDDSRRAIELGDKRAEPYITLSTALARLGRLPDATAACRQACEQEPNNASAMANLAGLLAQQKQLAEAIVVCRRALQIDPDAAATRMNLAIMLFSTGDRQGAVSEAEQAVARVPDDDVMQTRLGFLLEQAGRRQDAISHYTAALELNPNNNLARQGLLRLGAGLRH